MSKFEVKIIYYIEKDEPVAEIYYDSSQWAQIEKKNDELKIDFYSPPNEEFWEFPCEEALKILERAKNLLLMKRNRRPFFIEEPDPKIVNQQAEDVLEAILNHPEKFTIKGRLKRFGDVVDIFAPDMGGARYSKSGEFIGFLEP